VCNDDGIDISDTELAEIKLKYSKDNRIELIPTDIRHVLFCGPGRAGKTNTMSVLKDPCFCPNERSMFAGTKETEFRSYALRNKIEQKIHSHVLGLIDSPGAFEIVATDSDYVAKTNSEIGQLISYCLSREVTYLNLIVLFIPIAIQVPEKHALAVDLFIKLFSLKIPLTWDDIEIKNKKLLEEKLKLNQKSDYKRIEEIDISIAENNLKGPMKMILCLTFADTVRDDILEDFKTQLSKNPHTCHYFEKDNNKIEIVPMGCADYFSKEMDVRSYNRTMLRVSKWRERFLEIMLDTEKRTALINTNIYGQRSCEIAELMKTCSNVLDIVYKSKTLDSTTRYGHIGNIDTLDKNFALVSGSVEYRDSVDDFYHLLNLVNSLDFDIPLKKDVLGKWYRA